MSAQVNHNVNDHSSWIITVTNLMKPGVKQIEYLLRIYTTQITLQKPISGFSIKFASELKFCFWWYQQTFQNTSQKREALLSRTDHWDSQISRYMLPGFSKARTNKFSIHNFFYTKTLLSKASIASTKNISTETTSYIIHVLQSRDIEIHSLCENYTLTRKMGCNNIAPLALKEAQFKRNNPGLCRL